MPRRPIIVDDRLAKRVWGSESPIGKQLPLEPTRSPNLNATVVVGVGPPATGNRAI